jgi:hypothetical protein
MLLEKSQKLIELSQQKIKTKQYLDNKEGFKARNQQITQLLEQVNELVESLRLFRQHGLIAIDSDPNIKNVLQTLESVISNYQQNPEWILDNKNFDKTKLQSNINKITHKLKQQLLQSWQNYLRRKLSTPNQELLNVLDKIEDFKPNIAQIRRLELQINSEKLPKYQEQLNHINNLIEQLNKTWDTLNADNVPEEVLSFLKAAGNDRGAPLNLLTPTVRTWINEHQLSHTLRIRIS